MVELRVQISDDPHNKKFIERYVAEKPKHEKVLVWESANYVNIEYPGEVGFAIAGETIGSAIEKYRQVWPGYEYEILDKAPSWSINWG